MTISFMTEMKRRSHLEAKAFCTESNSKFTERTMFDVFDVQILEIVQR